MNMLLVACGDTAVLVDAGVMFPEPELFGVDLVIPDLSALDAYRGRIAALVLTHGHEDHIGAIAARDRPGRRPDLRDRRSRWRWSSRSSTSTASTRGDRLIAGHAAADGRRSGRSGSSSCASRTASRTAWRWRFTRRPASSCTPATSRSTRRRSTAQPFDLHRFAELGAAGRPGAASRTAPTPTGAGSPGSERDVIDGFEEIFSSATGKIVVTAFSTSVYRLQLLVDLAEQFERKVAFVGRGMQQTSQIAAAAGLPADPARLQIRDSDVRDYAARGRRSASAPARRASRWRPCPGSPSTTTGTSSSTPDDVVVFSARVIPGNEKAVGRVMNHVARRGADVVSDGDKHVHVSGHGSARRAEIGAFPRQAAVLRADTW